MRIDELSCMWLQYKSHAIKKTSYMQYHVIIDTHINKRLGHTEVEELTIVDILDFIESMKETLANKTIQDIVVVLKSIVKYGNMLELCHIPIEAIPSIKKDQKELRILDDSELMKMENYLLDEKTNKNIGILICLYTGMRLGEICALRWEDIDLEHLCISISKTISRISDHGKSITKIENPKTIYSMRYIPISKQLFNVLNAVESKKGFIITGSNKYLDPRSYQYYFKKVLKSLNLNDYNFHVLRHTFATKCVECQIDIKSLSEILGHSSVNITLSTYVHSSFRMKMKEIDKFRLF